MPKILRRRAINPKAYTPQQALEDCLFHRCDAHQDVRQLNAAEEMTSSECGACIAEEVIASRYQLLTVLEGYADSMTYNATLREKLASARERLNLLQPGAGEFLDGPLEER